MNILRNSGSRTLNTTGTHKYAFNPKQSKPFTQSNQFSSARKLWIDHRSDTIRSNASETADDTAYDQSPSQSAAECAPPSAAKTTDPPIPIKSLVYLADDQNTPIVVILRCEDRVSERSLCELLDISRKHCRLAPENLLPQLCGFAAGQVPPFGHKEPLFTIIDSSVATSDAILLDSTSGRVVSGKELIALCSNDNNARVAPITKQSIPGNSSNNGSTPSTSITTSSSSGNGTSSGAVTTTSANFPVPWQEPLFNGVAEFYCIVATTRKVARLLVFMNVIPEDVHEEQGDTDGVPKEQGDWQYLRKLWSHPVTGLPCELQLILGKTLEKRLGPTAASTLFKSLKAGQRLWVKGVPQSPLHQQHNLQNDDQKATTRQALDMVVHDIEILQDAPPTFAKRRFLASMYNKQAGLPAYSKKGGSLAFKPRLSKGEEYTGPYWGDEISHENILLVDTVEKLHQASIELKASKIIGIDSEWQPFSGEMPWTPVALLQLATADKAYLLDMLCLCGIVGSNGGTATSENETETTAKAKEMLKDLIQTILSDENITKVGFGLNNDLKRLLESYPWLLSTVGPQPLIPTNEKEDDSVSSFSTAESSTTEATEESKKLPLRGDIDLQGLSRLIIRDAMFHRRRISLSHLTQLVLGHPLDKMQQASDWGHRPLSLAQLRYAALDAFCLVEIYLEITKTAPEGLLTEDRLHQLSANISDLSTLIYPSFDSNNGFTSSSSESLSNSSSAVTRNLTGEGLAMRNYRMKRDEGSTPPGRVYFKQQRPLGSSQDCTCNIDALMSYFGRFIPEGGKVGVVRLATSDENGKLRHRLPRFPRGSGILEFQNAFLLFVNYPSFRYPNKFTVNEDGKFEMTWFPGKGQNLRHPGMQRLLGLLPTEEGSLASSSISLSENGYEEEATKKKTVILLCRPQRGPFIVCGRLAVASVNGIEEDAEYGQTIVRWCLLDSDGLRGKKSPVFESMLQLAAT